jgi:predicted glutamine amidotransferase
MKEWFGLACRMLVAAGKLSVPKILDDFKLVAMNRNEKHEKNEKNPIFVHSDGWGIVVGNSGKLDFYKKAVPCWEDPKYLEYYDVNADFLVLHARKVPKEKKTVKHVNYAFTHPFEKDGWFFCHNGTVTDFDKPNMSDSETFFSLLLDKMKEKNSVPEAIEDAMRQLKEYTALNIILANKRKAYVLNKWVLNYPKYYTMKYLAGEDYAIVSSERLGHFEGWNPMGNNVLVELDIPTHKIMPLQIG